MKLKVLVLLLFTGLLKSNAQFLLERCSLTQANQFEDSLHSTLLGIEEKTCKSNLIYTELGEFKYYPFCFRRNNEKFNPSCRAEYFYGGEDSMIAAIVYSWNIENENKNIRKDKTKWKYELSRKNEYLVKYTSLVEYFNSNIGKPEFSDDLNSRNEINFSGESLWKDSTRIISLFLTYIADTVDIVPTDGKLDLIVKIEWPKYTNNIYSTPNGEKIDLSQRPDVMAKFESGESGMVKFFAKNLKDLGPSVNQGSKVYVSFVVDKKGVVRNAKIIKGLDQKTDEEVLRVINLSTGKWISAKIGDKKIDSMMMLPIVF